MASSNEWTVFIDRCFAKRLRSEKFSLLVSAFYSKTPLAGHTLVAIVLRRRSTGRPAPDPRIPLFVDSLLSLGYITSSDVLQVLLRATDGHSQDHHAEQCQATNELPLYSSLELDEILFQQLTKHFSTGHCPKNSKDVRSTLSAIAQWTYILGSKLNSTILMRQTGIKTQQQQKCIAMACEGLGLLIVAILENPKVINVMNSALPKGIHIL